MPMSGKLQELSYEIVEVQTREQAQDVFAACDESNIASWRLIQTGNQEAGSLGSGASGQLFLQFEEEKGIFVCMLSFAIRFLSLIKSVFLWFPPQNIIPFQMNRKVTRGPICYNSQHWSCVTSPCSW